MKRKEYLVFLFSTIIVGLTGLNTNYSAVVDHSNEPKYLQAVPIACKSVDKKIAAQEEALRTAIKKLEEAALSQTFFSLLEETDRQLQETSTFKRIQSIQECLELLTIITSYNNHLIQPNLLQKIDHFHKQDSLQSYDTLASFLRRQRIHLLEMNDEYIIIQTFYRQIKNIEKDLQAELFSLEDKLHSLACITNLKTAHLQHLECPTTQEFKKTCKALWKLYLEKESKIIKHRDYVDFLYEQQQTNIGQDPLMVDCINNLQRIISLEKKYFCQPLSIQNLLTFIHQKNKSSASS